MKEPEEGCLQGATHSHAAWGKCRWPHSEKEEKKGFECQNETGQGSPVLGELGSEGNVQRVREKRSF